MCLGIPGRVVDVHREQDILMGKVDFGGVTKSICLECTPQVQPGEYVIVHVGFALQVIDEARAQDVFRFLVQMGETDEFALAEGVSPMSGGAYQNAPDGETPP
uniref:HypC/HybG/HupF family hydrogenase formation chaperone n=1 Tax=Schlesneria paludicola TaxID=360056 RepID=A0A7C2P350_9PLAN